MKSAAGAKAWMPAAAGMKPARPDTLLALACVVLLYSDVLGGVLKYVAVKVHALPLAYGPMALLALAVAWAGWAARRGAGLALAAFFGFYLVYGCAFGAPAARQALALYTWLPFMGGLLWAGQGGAESLRRQAPWLWLLAVAGVLLNHAVGFAWSGQTYEVFGLVRESARAWRTLDIDRLAGFSRASFAAADQIVLLTLALLTAPGAKRWLKVCLWALAVYAGALTTSKTPLLALAAGPLGLGVHALLERRWGREAARWGAVAMAGALLGVMVLLPLLPLGMFVDAGFRWGFVQFASLLERALVTWPAAFGLLGGEENPMVWLLGRGLGGIGLAQQWSEPFLYNPGDNLLVYLYVTFGVGALALAGLLLAGLARAAEAEKELLLVLALGALVIGLGANGIESPTVALVLGLVGGGALRSRAAQ